MAIVTQINTQPAFLTKTAAEIEQFNLDFSEHLLISGGILATIISVTQQGDGKLVFGLPVIFGNLVQVQISSGTAGQSYFVRCLCLTNLGETLEAVGGLQIT